MAAFVCPEKGEAEKRTQLLSKIKDIVQKAEQDLTVPVHQVPMNCQTHYPPKKEKVVGNPLPPDVMVCYKMPGSKAAQAFEEHVVPVSSSKSRELRAGILYTGCHCCKRYGLQDHCPRAECQGSPSCLTQPPSCGPVAYCDARHLISKMKTAKGSKGSKTEPKIKYKCFPAAIKAPEPPFCVTMCVNPMV